MSSSLECSESDLCGELEEVLHGEAEVTTAEVHHPQSEAMLAEAAPAPAPASASAPSVAPDEAAELFNSDSLNIEIGNFICNLFDLDMWARVVDGPNTKTILVTDTCAATYVFIRDVKSSAVGNMHVNPMYLPEICKNMWDMNEAASDPWNGIKDETRRSLIISSLVTTAFAEDTGLSLAQRTLVNNIVLFLSKCSETFKGTAFYYPCESGGLAAGPNTPPPRWEGRAGPRPPTRSHRPSGAQSPAPDAWRSGGRPP